MQTGDYPLYDAYIARPEAERKTLLLILDPQAEAEAWLIAYAKNLSEQVRSHEEDYSEGVSYAELVETAVSQIGDRYGDYISRGGAFEGEQVDPMLWVKLEKLLGIEIPQDRRNSFFSCSC